MFSLREIERQVPAQRARARKGVSIANIIYSSFKTSNGSAGDPAQVYRDRVHWSRWNIHLSYFDIWSFDPSALSLVFRQAHLHDLVCPTFHKPDRADPSVYNIGRSAGTGWGREFRDHPRSSDSSHLTT
jgi:hypothetical protein